MLRWQPTKSRPDETPDTFKRPLFTPRSKNERKSKGKNKRHSSPTPRYLVIQQVSAQHRSKLTLEGKWLNDEYANHYNHSVSLLHTAAELGDVASIQHLYHHRRVDLDARNENGESAVFLAALYNQPQAVSLLNSLGARVSTPDHLGQTPLFIAATENLVGVIEVLVQCGADVDTSNTYGCSPVGGAAMNGCDEAIRVLHERGGDIDARNKTGERSVVNTLRCNAVSLIEVHFVTCDVCLLRHVSLLHRRARRTSRHSAHPLFARCPTSLPRPRSYYTPLCSC